MIELLDKEINDYTSSGTPARCIIMSFVFYNKLIDHLNDIGDEKRLMQLYSLKYKKIPVFRSDDAKKNNCKERNGKFVIY